MGIYDHWTGGLDYWSQFFGRHTLTLFIGKWNYASRSLPPYTTTQYDHSRFVNFPQLQCISGTDKASILHFNASPCVITIEMAVKC